MGLFLIVVGLTRYVSLASVLASLAIPALILLAGGLPAVAGVAWAISAVVVFQHRGNIVRLVRGTERKLGEKAS